MVTTSDTSRQRVLEAVFRLVERGGLVEASLRKVAAESGINIGSVRHYFGSHEQLMIAAAEEVGRRMERRLEAARPAEDEVRPDRLGAVERRALVESVCRAVLPSAERGDEAELVVLLELVAAARLRPEFRPLAWRMGRDLRHVLHLTLEAVGVAHAELEAERLTALIGGLTVESLYPHGSAMPAPASAVLHRHLGELLPD